MTYRWSRLVYFIRREDGTGPIKIGCSTCPASRAKQIGFDYAAKFRVLAISKGGLPTEHWLHRRFAHCRADAPARNGRSTPIAGCTEWFDAHPELLRLIDDINGGLELPQYDDRDQLIVKRYRAGETLESIGQEVGLTRERVRQILAENGVARRTPSHCAHLRAQQRQARRIALATAA